MCGRVVVVKTLSREDQELEFEAYQQALALASGTGPQELGLQGMAAAAQSSKQWDDALAAASGGRGDHAWPPQEPSFNLPPAVPPGANQLPAKGGVEARRPSPLATATAVDATVNTDPAAAALRTHTDPRAVTAGALSSRSSTTSAGGGGADSGIGPDTIVLGPHRDSQAHIRAAPTPASTPMAAATAPTYSSMMAGMVSPSSANLAPSPQPSMTWRQCSSHLLLVQARRRRQPQLAQQRLRATHPSHLPCRHRQSRPSGSRLSRV